MNLIFDIGGNVGNNVSYYLHKSDRVVFVEADPKLCKDVSKRFFNEIKNKRLFIENGAISDINEEFCDFYIRNGSSEISSILKPNDFNGWRKIKVKTLNLNYLLKKYGIPDYIKIDIEFADNILLEQLISSGIRPRYISVESHTLEIFSLLSEKLGYKSFKLVEGWTLDRAKNKSVRIFSKLKNKYIELPFSVNTAYVFGEDLKGCWYEKDSFLRFLALKKLGWKDIHATNEFKGEEIGLLKLFLQVGLEILRKFTEFIYWKILKTLIRKFQIIFPIKKNKWKSNKLISK